MDHIVNTLTAGKHLVGNSEKKYYLGILPTNRWVGRIYFSLEDAQSATAYSKFDVFTEDGGYEATLKRVCGELVEED